MNEDEDYETLDEAGTYKYIFNFCQNTISSPCGQTDKEAAAFRNKVGEGEGAQCQILSDSKYSPNKIMTQESRFLDSSTETQESSNALSFGIGGGEECHSKPSSINFIIECDYSVTDRPTSFEVDSTDQCNPVIKFSHEAGCPISNQVSLMYRGYFTEKPFVLAVLLLLIGPFMLFYGRKQIDTILYISTAFVFFYLSLFVFHKLGMLNYIDKNTPGDGNLGLVLFSFALAMCAALLAGHTSYTFKPLGKLFLGGLAGYFFGCFVYNLFFIFWNKALVTLIVCQTVFLVIGAYLGYQLRDGFVIISTSILGAFATVRGIAMFAGGYPSEYDLYRDITSGNAKPDGVLFAYMGAMTALFALGFTYQRRGLFCNEDNFQKV